MPIASIAIDPATTPAATTTGSPRRSLAWLAVGALVGLALAGYSLFSASGSGAQTLPADAIAVVNGREILRRDFEVQLETEYGKPASEVTVAEKKTVVEAMIREELLVQRGLEIEVTKTDADVRQAVVNSVNRTSASEVESKPVTEEELKSYFEKNRENYVIFGSFKLRELILPVTETQSNADLELRAKGVAGELRGPNRDEAILAANAKFGLREARRPALADAESANQTDHELTEPVAEQVLGSSLYAVLIKLQPGEVSDPVRLPDGLHFLILEAHRQKSHHAFEEVRETVERNFRSDAQAKVQQELVDSLRRKAEIVKAKEQAW